jgi:hypothetical protein
VFAAAAACYGAVGIGLWVRLVPSLPKGMAVGASLCPIGSWLIYSHRIQQREVSLDVNTLLTIEIILSELFMYPIRIMNVPNQDR